MGSGGPFCEDKHLGNIPGRYLKSFYYRKKGQMTQKRAVLRRQTLILIVTAHTVTLFYQIIRRNLNYSISVRKGIIHSEKKSLPMCRVKVVGA